MLYARQADIDAAIGAMKALVMKITDTRGNAINHPGQFYSDRKWEAIICAMIASEMPTASAVMPEGSQFITGFGTDNEERFPNKVP